MRRLAVSVGAVAVVAGLLVPGVAAARTVSWGGLGFNDLGQSSALLSVTKGRVKVTNVQLIMACTDAADGTESERAFSTDYATATSLHLNHYAIAFTATSGGRIGHVRLTGVLGSNGRGTIRIDITATARTDGGGIVERCGGASRFALHRGG
jgi:hypothetical protein